MLLEVDGLKLYFKTLRGDVRAVDDVSFKLDRGRTLGIVGESGCGKSSTANAIVRNLPRNVSRYEGRILLEDMDLMLLNEAEFRSKIRWRRISMVFQGAMNSLNPVLKVGFQVAEPLIIHKGLSREEALKNVEELFRLVGLSPDIANRYPHELSGGMKQRAIIAMALTLNPDIIILDEPTSALDVSIQAQIMNLLKSLKRKLGISMIFITHDIALASDICDEFGVMYAGEIVELGSAEQVLLSPKHPYTQKLLNSIPRLRSDRIPEFIPGSPPDLVNPPPGCRFHPRCQYVMDKCSTENPPKTLMNNGFVKCWLYK
jgi:peptide/nickel transport system ATP-binding protein